MHYFQSNIHSTWCLAFESVKNITRFFKIWKQWSCFFSGSVVDVEEISFSLFFFLPFSSDHLLRYWFLRQGNSQLEKYYFQLFWGPKTNAFLWNIFYLKQKWCTLTQNWSCIKAYARKNWKYFDLDHSTVLQSIFLCKDCLIMGIFSSYFAKFKKSRAR